MAIQALNDRVTGLRRGPGSDPSFVGKPVTILGGRPILDFFVPGRGGCVPRCPPMPFPSPLPPARPNPAQQVLQILQQLLGILSQVLGGIGRSPAKTPVDI